MKHYLVRPFDVLYFRGNKAFDFGEWYSEGVFPPYPSTFQGFVRTVLLKANNLIVSEKELKPEADKLIGDDNNMPFEICGPYLLFKDEFYLPTPFDIQPDNNNGKANQIRLSEDGIKTDLGFKIHFANFDEKPRYLHWQEELCSLSSINEFRKNCIFIRQSQSNSDHVINDISPIETENRVGIQLDYGNGTEKKKNTKESMFYMTPYVRLNDHCRLYFNLTIDTPNLDGVDCKLGSEGRGAICEITDKNLNLKMEDSFYEDIVMKDNVFKLILLQPGLFEHGWLPFEPENELVDDYMVLNYHNLRLKLIFARTAGIKKISGMSMRKQAQGEIGDKYGLKPMLDAIPAGSVYYFEILDANESMIDTVKSIDGEKIPLQNTIYPAMGFNQVIIGKVKR